MTVPPPPAARREPSPLCLVVLAGIAVALGITVVFLALTVSLW